LYEGSQSNDSFESEIKTKEADHRIPVKKIMLLGSEGSGKSLVYKQLRQLYTESDTSSLRVDNIYDLCIDQMEYAVEALDAFQEGDVEIEENYRRYAAMDETKLSHLVFGFIREHEDNAHLKVPHEIQSEILSRMSRGSDGDIPNLSEKGKEAAEYILNLRHRPETIGLDPEIVSQLKVLWAEPAIKKMYELRNITTIQESANYFWNRLDTIADPSYTPDLSDMLRAHLRTTGFNEISFEIRGKRMFQIVDLGGQRSERSKWIYCFDRAVSAVIFVASLSCYDEVLRENYSVNAMTEQLTLFGVVVNNRYFADIPMILLLNKKDLFAEKIQRVPLQKCPSFSTYNGAPTSFDEATKYIRASFTSLNKRPDEHPVFTHITCATDTENIKSVFADVQRIVVEDELRRGGCDCCEWLLDQDNNNPNLT